jgi:hypothetical protein
MKKTILVLANSIRSSFRCIAGREARLDGDAWTIGPWVRPVSRQGEGEIRPQESACTDGTQPSVLDIITVTLASKVDCPHQPENYMIESGHPWEKIGRVDPDISSLVEQPATLWLQQRSRSDRIHSTVVASIQNLQSLYLIRPTNLRFRIWREENPFRGGLRKQRRALFTYSGTSYDLPVTDPTMDARYFTSFPALNQAPREITPANPQQCLLVISLSAPFTDAYHYKLATTLIEY